MAELQDYLNMQKGFYENKIHDPKSIVGHWDFHQSFPYKELIFKKINSDIKDLIVLDFGCGPGRMIERVAPLVSRCDGIDISSYLIDEAKKVSPQISNLYVCDGKSLGEAKDNEYDLIFSTICLQHIASFSIRKLILQDMYRCLKIGGKIALEFAYVDKFIEPEDKNSFAYWEEDKFDAKGTNSSCDCIIDHKRLMTTFTSLFAQCNFKNIDATLTTLKTPHIQYSAFDIDREREYTQNNPEKQGWSSHSLFIYGEK